jgi:hypothetical protein
MPDIMPGDYAVWLRTLGGGGGTGHRENEKEPVHVRVLARKKRLRIQPRHGQPVYPGPRWVSPDSVVTVAEASYRLIADVSNAAFECGEWDRNESDEKYETVHDRLEKATRLLAAFIGLVSS